MVVLDIGYEAVRVSENGDTKYTMMMMKIRYGAPELGIE